MFCDHEAKYISEIRVCDGLHSAADQVKVPIPDTPYARMYYLSDTHMTTYPTNNRQHFLKSIDFLLRPSITRSPKGSVEEFKWYYDDEFD